jgi:hypothetical protein
MPSAHKISRHSQELADAIIEFLVEYPQGISEERIRKAIIPMIGNNQFKTTRADSKRFVDYICALRFLKDEKILITSGIDGFRIDPMKMLCLAARK